MNNDNSSVNEITLTMKTEMTLIQIVTLTMKTL